MRRLFRISFLTVMLCVLGLSVGHAQNKPEVLVGGRVAPGDVRVFSKDTVYKVFNKLVIGGTLIIEPGTTVKFPPNGRIIDSTGGRIIADGYASATYNTNLIPIGNNPNGWTGYADLNYFIDSRVINMDSRRWEPTVNVKKEDYVFNVILNLKTRKLRDGGDLLNNPILRNGTKFTGLNPAGDPDGEEVVIPFEKAIYYLVSTIHEVVDPVTDIRNDFYWKRANSSDTMKLTSGTINFIGQSTNSFTRERGHIVILPGARAAFFRGCKFENMRKDTTVDYTDYYNSIDKLTADEVASINKAIVSQTNGAGGAITTFSSRTWLVDCEFNHNFARNAAGALQVLQAPKGYYEVGIPAGMGTYPAYKNPALTEPNGQKSRYNDNIARVDNLDEEFATEMLTDNERQAYDDARLSIFLGRMRGLKFNSNNVKLSNVKIKYVGSIPVEYDDLDAVCTYPQHYGNYAKGGAVLISGRPNDFTPASRIEVGLGVNNKITIRHSSNTKDTTIVLSEVDSLKFFNNNAENYQEDNRTNGAMGGAIYLGTNTSLIVAGKFESNTASTVKLGEDVKSVEAGLYARGGAIFQENTFGRLQVRGSKTNLTASPSFFTSNKAASGGAIYVDGNDDKSMSPIIGGADNTSATRDYGYNMKFITNEAKAEGGAIYTHRNMRINGAGGVINKEPAGLYTDSARILFDQNEAGYSGGAIAIALLHNDLLTNKDRSIHLVRSLFKNNKVGEADVVSNSFRNKVRGGGAIYSEFSDMNVVKAVEFNANTVRNGNGAAIHMATPATFSKKFFVSDLDEVAYTKYDNITGAVVGTVFNETSLDFLSNTYYALPTSFRSYDDPFIQRDNGDKFVADGKMLTRFLDNKISTDEEIFASQSGSGMTQINAGTIATNANINAVEFVDTDNGFAVGDKGTVIKLTNGGQVWAYKNLNTDVKLTAIHFTTDQIGFIAGDQGKIWKTVDGGNTWNSVSTNGFFNINAMTFFNSTEGYAVGQSGQMMVTNNAGNTWTVAPTGTANHLKDVSFIGSDNNGNPMGYIVGNRGTILVKRGTNNWTPQNANTFADFNSVYFTDASTGFIAGNGVIYKTTNNGQTWVNVFNKSNVSFNKIVFTSLDNGFAYGNAGAVYKTTNGGQTWDSTEIMLNGVKQFSPFHDAFYPTQNAAVVASDAGLMLRTTDNGATWTTILPIDQSRVDIKRLHPSLNVRENGIGLGAALYIIDSVTTREGKDDYVRFNRVRFEGNEAFSGAAIYSDNYDLKLVLSRSLAIANKATSTIGMNQNAITGPANDQVADGVIDGNFASSDLAGAIFYGEIVGPVFNRDITRDVTLDSYSWAANSIYGNDARFLIRLPDAPNTKGAFAGRRPGPGGIDTLQGNYWGKTQADVTLYIDNLKDEVYTDASGNSLIELERNPTFFVAECDTTYLSYVFGAEGNKTRVLQQGPFETNGTYNLIGSANEGIKLFEYEPISLRNKSDNENVADSNTIPEKFLMSGRIYDLLDKGTDIKVADYSNRRFSPIEDFAVGIPPTIVSHVDTKHPNGSTYVTRWVRNPFDVEARDAEGNLKYPMLAELQTEWQADRTNLNDATKGFYQPIGYPLFLETKVKYSGTNVDPDVLNDDERFLNETVFFVINETTGDFIRTNMLQVEEKGQGTRYETFRSRVELVPDLTMRNQNTAIRRDAENLLSLGSGHLLMSNLKFNPIQEDNGTLEGRKYYGPHTLMGGQDRTGINDLYINKDIWPASNNSYATYFAGEKYQALPVLVGDVVRVISRTQLWKSTIEKAFLEGISFKIVNSTMPPFFTGDVVKLQNYNVPEFKNTILVTEDRTYPCPDGQDPYSTLGSASGRDSILAVTAIDYNNFYDPRAVTDSLKDFYANLRYTLNTPANSGVSKWLRYELRTAGSNTKDSANGYMVLRGTPMNPYIVPGGEQVYVSAYNFAPSRQTIDWVTNEFSQDVKDKFMYIYPSYFNAPKYDLDEVSRRARYLQQDTILNNRDFAVNYNFKLMVVDSTPRFIAYNDNNYPSVQYMDINYNPLDSIPAFQDSNKVRVMYLPTNYSNGFCTMTADGKIIASVTDKLRLQADFNTDDEAEDIWAGRAGWDFKYGKTSYGFWNIASRNNPSETISIDEKNQTRPTWMANIYNYKYNSDNTSATSTDKDQYLSNFTSEGRLNIRIDGTVARNLLGVNGGTNKAMNLDTVFTIVANDGHSGMTVMPVDVYVNVAPQITNAETLPGAVEGTDYNPSLTDTNKVIKIYDPNADQTHRFELIYKNDPRAQIAKDPCFSEAGNWDLGALKTTPSWLKINPVNGMLYGKPTVSELDSTKTENITVAVWDKIEQASIKANINALKSVGNSLFAVGDQGIIVKIDAATTKWDFIKTPVAQTIKLNDVTFAKPNYQVGYIVGNSGLILKTTNGGTTWDTIPNTNVAQFRHYNFNTVDFIDDNNGIVAGDEGNLFTTTNGGATWTEVKKMNKTYTNNTTITKAKMFGPTEYILGLSNGQTIRTTNGSTYTPIATPAFSAVQDIYEVSATKTMMISEDQAFTSSDKGATWASVNTPMVGVDNFTSIGYYEVGDNATFGTTKESVVYITGNNATLYVSNDGGANFTKSNVANFKFDAASENITNNLNDLVMVNPNKGFVVADNGIIAHIAKSIKTYEVKDFLGTRTVTDTVITPVVITNKEYDMLSDVKTFKMNVEALNHNPEITSAVNPGCVQIGDTASTFIYVMDNDLLRPNSSEKIALRIVSPSNNTWVLKDTVTKADKEFVTSADLPIRNENGMIPVILTSKGPLTDAGAINENGRVIVQIEAKDSKGNTQLIDVSFRFSKEPDFISYITVANSNNSKQVLEWGTAPNVPNQPVEVTTGDGKSFPGQQDNVPGDSIGALDANYCEYEIPPVPDKKIFDARWTIPTRTGTLRNIHPRALQSTMCELVYKATFQTGGNVDATGTSNYVPIRISWDTTLIPDKTDAIKNPAGSTWYLRDASSNGNVFNINMREGKGTYMGALNMYYAGTTVILQLNSVVTNGFNIVFDCTSAVEEDGSVVAGIQSVGPNPVTSTSTVTFGVKQYGNVRLEVYDAIGNLVNTITNEDFATGVHAVEFNGKDFSGNNLANGTYTVRMISGTDVSTYQVKVVR